MANTGWQVCIINFFHSLLAIILKLCIVIADVLKMYTCLFEKDNVIFDKIAFFSNLENFRAMGNTG